MEAEAARAGRAFGLSAVTGEGLPALLDAIEAGLSEARRDARLRIGHGDGRAVAWLHQRGLVVARSDDEDATVMAVSISERELGQFLKTFPEASALPEAGTEPQAAQ
jgi:GTP-binding protein HflX